MKVIRNSLILASNRNCMVEVHYKDEDFEDFDIGFIDIVSDNCFGIKYVNSYGEPDGYVVRSISDILVVKENTEYMRELTIFYNNYYDSFNEEYSLEEKDDIILKTLNKALARGDFVKLRIFDFDDDFNGYINSIDEDSINFSIVSQYGEDDGCCTLRLGSICALTVNSKREKMRKFLYQYKKQKNKDNLLDNPSLS